MADSAHKSTIALTKVMSDLSNKQAHCFIPICEYHLPYDLLVATQHAVYKIQVKYSQNGKVSNDTSLYAGRKNYKETDFDYYAVYLPTIDTVIYPHISFRGKIIATTPRKTPNPFYWYEDFLSFTDKAEKRSYKDFNISLKRSK